MQTRSKGQLEEALSAAITKHERDSKGRGPSLARAYLFGDMIVFRLKGVLLPVERQLLQGSTSMEGLQLVKRIGSVLVEQGRRWIEELVRETVGARVISLFADTSTRSDERVIVLTLDREVNTPEKAERREF